ncbi:MAG: hypothetical protein JOZ94_19850 [Xanthobacteraceae bacterium]|nr:hypothetical protein [Xanthobacteraceae bacterium]MBV9628526.1 hypothetical protein [Xanthobacteraceae bacterium]
MAGVVALLSFARESIMATPQAFLENWVRESVRATPYRNKAEARRLAYECRKAAERADLSWFAVVLAAGGDVQDYILTELNQQQNEPAS